MCNPKIKFPSWELDFSCFLHIFRMYQNDTLIPMQNHFYT